MNDVKRHLTPVPGGDPRERRRRSAQTIDARRRLEGRERPGHGRAWLNGHEVGGTDPRFAHLHRSHD